MSAERIELVLLPGLDGTGDLFAWLQRRLPEDLPVTVVRYPNDPSMGYEDYMAFARSKIGTRRVVVLGESFSGPVAVKLVAALPDQIAGLILAATFLKSPWPPLLVRRAASVNPHQAPRAARDAFLMGRYRSQEVSAKVDDIIRQLTPGLRSARLKAVAGVDVRHDFAKLSCPVLALHGRADWVVPPRTTKAFIKSKPGAELALFASAHMLLQSRPAETAEAIVNFINRIAGRT